MNPIMDRIHLILAVLFLSFSFSAALCNSEDKKALIAFKNSFPKNSFPDNWDAQDDCCLWGGVECNDNTRTRVTSLFFTSDSSDPDYVPINLTGTIPPSLGDFTHLQTFGLFGFPKLVGPIPPRMANMKNIQSFVVYYCGISGPIPSFLSTWASLQQLIISNCKLTGSIPTSLGNLVNLTSVLLPNNKLTGTIPGSLFSKVNNGSRPSFEVNHNMLTGPIPRSFASIDTLDIDVSYNQLCGPIPTGGVFASINLVFVDHNKCLCGPPLAACK